jgi:hypothetical protein
MQLDGVSILHSPKRTIFRDVGCVTRDALRQMQNRFASELSLPQALCDITNVVPGSLHLDWRPQLLLCYHLREPGQIFRSALHASNADESLDKTVVALAMHRWWKPHN